MIRSIAAAFVLLAAPATAQVVVGPTFALTMHSVPHASCPSGEPIEQWQITYGPPPCYVPDGFPPTGSPFIVGIRVRVTPADTTQAPRIVTVPRASVYRLVSVSGCAPTASPCLSVRLPSVPGPFLVDVAFIDGQGFASAWSDALPAIGPAVTPPPTTGIQPVQGWRLRP